MKFWSMLVWLTQLGLSTAFPLAGFVLLAVWLRSRFDLGAWVLWVGILFGVVCAVDGFRTSLKAMERMAKSIDRDQDPPDVSFNEHD